MEAADAGGAMLVMCADARTPHHSRPLQGLTYVRHAMFGRRRNKGRWAGRRRLLRRQQGRYEVDPRFIQRPGKARRALVGSSTRGSVVVGDSRRSGSDAVHTLTAGRPLLSVVSWSSHCAVQLRHSASRPAQSPQASINHTGTRVEVSVPHPHPTSRAPLNNPPLPCRQYAGLRTLQTRDTVRR
jgi:hypothetical protein